MKKEKNGKRKVNRDKWMRNEGKEIKWMGKERSNELRDK